MAIKNLGYRPIYKLDTPADMKLLNDTLRALWLKLMGGINSRDLTGDAQKQISGAYEGTLGTLRTAISQVDAKVNDTQARVTSVERRTDDAEGGIEALTASLAAAQDEVKVLNTAQAGLAARVKALEDAAGGGA